MKTFSYIFLINFLYYILILLNHDDSFYFSINIYLFPLSILSQLFLNIRNSVEITQENAKYIYINLY